MPSKHDARMIVHGGAWDIPAALRGPHREGCLTALHEGLAVLDSGGSAVDGVVAAVCALEDDPTFNAGRGSFLNVDGDVQMDAGIMDGSSLAVGAVACIRGVRNPIRLARVILDTPECLLVADGAVRLAEADQLELCPDDWHITPASRQYWLKDAGTVTSADEFFAVPRGTVGAVARDCRGLIAAATSTGGAPGTPAGRVGDSPIAGAGFFADDTLGGTSATGWGEGFFRMQISYRAVCQLRDGDPTQACTLGLGELHRIKGRGGLIMIDRYGRIGYRFNTPAMAFAYRDETGSFHSGPDESGTTRD